MARGIYLIGFSGTGKSTLGKLVGDMLGWPTCDLDELIEKRTGLTIPVIFQREGEPGFRARETEALRAASKEGFFVIATGGGTIVRPENRILMARNGWVICLEAQPQTLLSRLQRQLAADPKAIRPMLDSVYPLDKIRTLKHLRQPLYSLSDWTVHTDRLTTEEVAREVVRAAEVLERSGEPPKVEEVLGVPMRHTLTPDSPPPILIAAGHWPYQVVVDWNHLPALGEQVRRLLPYARRAAILTDERTWGRLSKTLQESLHAVGLEIHVRISDSSQAIKTPEEASAIHDWLLGIPFRRDDVFIIVGGGAIDDLGGFAASTYMRGVALVKIPTSLEGMVDSSFGGKTALNHPKAPNLIGTFFHPRLVWEDASLLLDEPKEDFRAALAEVVKYAMLEGSLLRDQVVGISLFDQLRQSVTELTSAPSRTILDIIARCVALKAQVVASDERDLGEYRVLLNYGHTIGHALESITDYKLLHGEAVAIGMAIEASLSVRIGLAPPEVKTRQNELLTQFGLPTRLPQVSHDLLLARIGSDKKVFGDTPRWILPVAVGRSMISSQVTKADLIAVLKECS
jgi:3-dehydroquinate synthetase/shikimate kinase